MTIYDAIKKECNNNFFIEKTKYVNSYDDAIEYFIYPTVYRALRKCSVDGVEIYNKGPGFTRGLLLAKDYVINISSGKTNEDFRVIFTAKKCKERNGWEIQLSSGSGILDAANLKEFVTQTRMAKIQDQIADLQSQITDLLKYYNKLKKSVAEN